MDKFHSDVKAFGLELKQLDKMSSTLPAPSVENLSTMGSCNKLLQLIRTFRRSI